MRRACACAPRARPHLGVRACDVKVTSKCTSSHARRGLSSRVTCASMGHAVPGATSVIICETTVGGDGVGGDLECVSLM